MVDLQYTAKVSSNSLMKKAPIKRIDVNLSVIREQRKGGFSSRERLINVELAGL